MVQFEDFSCEHDGVPLQGYFARPQSGRGSGLGSGRDPAPGVIAFPGAAGGEERMRMTVTKLAERGYLAAAVSMYDSRADTSSDIAAGTQFMALTKTPDRLRARARRWFDAFAALPEVDPARLATLGYCFGGKCVLEIARSGADVKATVCYHGLLTTHAAARPGAIGGLVAAYCAGRDPYVPASDIEQFRQELSDAGVSHHLTIFSDAQHAFTDPNADAHALEGIAFDPLAEAASWAGTVALLDRLLAVGD